MTIEITKNTVGIWFCYLGNDSDWMGSASEEAGVFHLIYRFRYYKSDDAWDNKDKKNWYEGTHKGGTRDEVIDKMRTMLKLMELKSRSKGYELLMVDGNIDEFMGEFNKQPWVHTKTMSKEEYEKSHRAH